MHLAEAQEFGAFKAGDHPQHSGLFAEPHVILKADQIVTARARVFLAKLRPPRTAAGRCADRSAPSVSSVRTAVSRVLDARFLRSADTLRSSAT